MKNIENAEKYSWGERCFGWHLLKDKALGVIQELMPPGTSESLHRHHKAQQFFYILKGEALFTIGDKEETLHSFQGIAIEPGLRHCIKNKGTIDLEFLVISAPHSHGDREEL